MIAPMHDVDSLVAHTVGEIWQPGIEHKVLEYKHEHEPFEDIPEKSDQYIAMADFGYSGSETVKKMVDKLERIRAAGTQVSFYDQHNWAPEIQVRAFTKYTYSNDMSSAEIIALDLIRKDPLAMYLAKIASNEDYGRHDDETRKLTDLVNSHIPKIDLIKELAGLQSQRLDLSSSFEDALQDYRTQLKPQAEEKLISSVTEHQTRMGNFKIGLAPSLLYMKPGHRHLRDNNLDYNTLCFYEGFDNVLFRTQNRTQTEALLGLFDGDSRDTEGGFDPGEPVTEANYIEVRDRVIDKIRSLR